MKKAILIDDELLARSIVENYLKDFDDIELVASCSNGFEGAKMIAELEPDLIFLDIQMPKINGFEMLEIIPNPPAVIFTTAFDEFALKAFEINALDYLLKPFSRERFRSAVEKWQKQTENLVESKTAPTANLAENRPKRPDELNRIVIKDGAEISILAVSDIHYIEACDDYVKFVLSDSHYLKKQTMSYYEKSLESAQFVRIHRSFILNLNQLTKIESFEKNSYVAILRNGKRLPISRNSYGELKMKLGI